MCGKLLKHHESGDENCALYGKRIKLLFQYFYRFFFFLTYSNFGFLLFWPLLIDNISGHVQALIINSNNEEISRIYMSF